MPVYGISFGEAFLVWVALPGFGGPAGQIVVMHRILVGKNPDFWGIT
jgi:chromate transport protein ChrA